MVKIPELKKKIHSFLTKEDGKISKENLIKTGVLLSAVAFASVEGAEATHSDTLHANSLQLSYDSPDAVGTHNHSPEHSAHSSHSSHGSHGSHNSW